MCDSAENSVEAKIFNYISNTLFNFIIKLILIIMLKLQNKTIFVKHFTNNCLMSRTVIGRGLFYVKVSLFQGPFVSWSLSHNLYLKEYAHEEVFDLRAVFDFPYYHNNAISRCCHLTNDILPSSTISVSCCPRINTSPPLTIRHLDCPAVNDLTSASTLSD